MILVAFVLVLFATVMLIIGTFFDAGTAYIWVSIGACVATFVVLAISYYSRRRGADGEAARPAPLAADTSRSAAAPRSSAVGGGTSTLVREERATDTEQDVETGTEDADGDDERTVTIVPGRQEAAAAPTAGVVGGDADEEEAGAGAEQDEAESVTPAPAPRRVVRRPGPPKEPAARTATEPVEEEVAAAPSTPVPTQPRIVATGTRPAPSPEGPDQSETDAPSTPPTEVAGADEDAPSPSAPRTARKVVRRPAPTGEGGTRKVVRRVASASDGGTRKVVRRTPRTSSTTRRVVRQAAADGGTARTVRATGTGGETRTVRRVVRSAGSAQAEPAADDRPRSNRTGTRGKRARAVLSDIKGVGPAKQDALLKEFGSLEVMAEASIEDIAAIKGVGEAVAGEIKRVLQDR